MSEAFKYEHKKSDITEELYQYMIDHCVRWDKTQQELITLTLNHEWSIMGTTPDQHTFFQFLLKILNAKKCIDVGVFTGLSSLAMALALPEDGKVYALDVSTQYTDLAKPFWKKAGVENKIDLRIAPAAETLQKLVDTEPGTIDFIFIDADKTGYDTYYELGLKLIRKGGVIAFDNVFQSGRVLKKPLPDISAVAIDTLNKKLLNDPRVFISSLPVADGITLITKI
ncbi:O-methyltransferase family 3 protein [Tieghemostelium lacteum]|uniref:O-methyltransferase family 3 protein n=1 Tax=Tieghemostelium lacteum TaxID=361077 RepID=A0A152A9L6_TIELA|nr:O-methyltransferase family 3 protein [Tieghemostelium lacteum]|eukprot:KYR02922.1 O-methyltransferase family 3 protein [Tieghemostelium lacteum]